MSRNQGANSKPSVYFEQDRPLNTIVSVNKIIGKDTNIYLKNMAANVCIDPSFMMSTKDVIVSCNSTNLCIIIN